MAKAKAGSESKSATFKRLYEANLNLLKVTGYDHLFQLYQAEDSSRQIGTSERQVAANVKSRLRKIHKFRGGRRGKRRKGTNGAMVSAAPGPRTGLSHLALEDSIDDCIFLARRMGTAGLDDVVKLLRRARNHLIIMTGTK